MAIMAIDHVGLFVGNFHWSEHWGVALPDYASDLPLFFTRLLTHLCAPGFFFFMGIGVILYAHTATSRGHSPKNIRHYLLIRGALLLLIQQIIENPAWLLGVTSIQPGDFRGTMVSPGDGSTPLLHFSVLACLGWVLMVASLVWQRSLIFLIVLALSMFIIGAALLPDASRFSDALPYWQILLAVPGRNYPVNVLYPLLPWLSVGLIGLAFGKLLVENRTATIQRAALFGVSCLCLFVMIRLSPIGDSTRAETTGLIGFLSVTKYPPSAEFLLLTLGVNLILLWFWHRLSQASSDKAGSNRLIWTLTPLRVFGQCALFFYIAHLYLYALLGHALPGPASLYTVYATWLLGLVVLFVLCRQYSRFKRSKPTDSLWRFF